MGADPQKDINIIKKEDTILFQLLLHGNMIFLS